MGTCGGGQEEGELPCREDLHLLPLFSKPQFPTWQRIKGL